MYQLNPFLYAPIGVYERLYTVAGTYKMPIAPGRYKVMVCGAGGAGGTSTGATGGAGGTATVQTFTFDATTAANFRIYVGAGGKTYANGGNGGLGGASSAGRPGGAGGGGGYPSYVVSPAGDVYASLGGGGGGGAGGNSGYGRYAGGGGGGGGGGYYRFNTDTLQIQSVPGQAGGAGAGGNSYMNGGNGTVGNTTDFPGVYSAGGAAGARTRAGSGASGGGASGGGGGEAGNTSGGLGGGGGGGAGGDMDAGGGRGDITSAAYNSHTTPTSGTNNKGDAVTSGWGIGGAPGQNGADGWVYIVRTGDVPK